MTYSILCTYANKICWITYYFILLHDKKASPLCRKPKTIFFTLEIVPIGNHKKGLSDKLLFMVLIYRVLVKHNVSVGILFTLYSVDDSTHYYLHVEQE